jgi:hypothetical protein
VEYGARNSTPYRRLFTIIGVSKRMKKHPTTLTMAIWLRITALVIWMVILETIEQITFIDIKLIW